MRRLSSTLVTSSFSAAVAAWLVWTFNPADPALYLADVAFWSFVLGGALAVIAAVKNRLRGDE